MRFFEALEMELERVNERVQRINNILAEKTNDEEATKRLHMRRDQWLMYRVSLLNAQRGRPSLNMYWGATIEI